MGFDPEQIKAFEEKLAESIIEGPTPATLADTTTFMLSSDYKKRFQAEYFQTKIRYLKLQKMLKQWNEGKLNFTPTCSKQLFRRQLLGMEMYLDALKERAAIEQVDISIDAVVTMQVMRGAEDAAQGRCLSFEEVMKKMDEKFSGEKKSD